MHLPHFSLFAEEVALGGAEKMWPVELSLLLLILIANGMPIITAKVCGQWAARPLDNGWIMADGRRLLGDSKTWRGVLSATLMTGLCAVLLGWPIQIGMTIGLAAMLGDGLSSFIKRRLDLSSSSKALGLDQIPEALLPLLAVAGYFDLQWWKIILMVAGFAILELALSPIFYWLGIRKQPY